MNARRSPLDLIQIATPCAVSWDAMGGDDRTRHCGQCERQVYNIGGMSRAAAEDLIHTSEGRLCVRLYRRRDGTVMTSDCPVGIWAWRRKLAAACLLMLGLSGAILGLAGWQRAEGQSSLRRIQPFRTVLEWLDPSPPPMIMGDICPPPGPPVPPVPPMPRENFE